MTAAATTAVASQQPATLPVPAPHVEPGEQVDLWLLERRSRPAARGWLHAAAALAAPAATAWLARRAPSRSQRAATAVYGAALSAMFTASGCYHRLARSPRSAKRLRRVDHAAIFAAVAGSATPLAVTALPPRWTPPALGALWAGAAAAAAAKLTRLDDHRPSTASWAYPVLAAAGSALLPSFARRAGGRPAALFTAGTGVYALGAAAFASGRPRLWPSVFGFHEVFHSATCAAAGLHFAAFAAAFSASAVLPAAG